MRTIKSALESRIGAKIPSSHPVMRWMAKHSADILNKYAGSEEDVYVRVCQKYGETPQQIL